MSATHTALEFDGEAVGDLITIGNCVTLFAVRRELADLDGAIFRSVGEARQAVAKHLGNSPSAGTFHLRREPVSRRASFFGVATMRRGEDS